MNTADRTHMIRQWRELEKPHNYRPAMGDYEPAMGFDEIAIALGTDKQHVWHWYKNGIKKLRRNPQELFRLLSIANDLAAEREKRSLREFC